MPDKFTHMGFVKKQSNEKIVFKENLPIDFEKELVIKLRMLG